MLLSGGLDGDEMTDTSVLFTRAAEYWNSVASDEYDSFSWRACAASVSGVLLAFESARVERDGGDSMRDQYLQALGALLDRVEERNGTEAATYAASIACLAQVSPYRPGAAETE